MDVERLVILLALAVLFPTFPLSIPAVFVMRRLKGGSGALMVVLPLAGFTVYSASGKEPAPQELVTLGLLSSLLYAFKSLSINSLEKWVLYHFVSVFSLIWLFLARAEINFVFVLGLVLLFFPLSVLVRILNSRFGSTNSGVIQGLGTKTPKIAFLLSLSILLSIAVPVSTLFFKTLTASLLSRAPELILLSCLWFLWGWSGMRVMSSLVFGRPRENLIYEDLDRKGTALLLFVSAVVLGLGALFMEALV